MTRPMPSNVSRSSKSPLVGKGIGSQGLGSDMDERPDGWERFERAVDAAVKSGPKHRPSKPVAKPARKRAADAAHLGLELVRRKVRCATRYRDWRRGIAALSGISSLDLGRSSGR